MFLLDEIQPLQSFKLLIQFVTCSQLFIHLLDSVSFKVNFPEAKSEHIDLQLFKQVFKLFSQFLISSLLFRGF